ncbi:hypothetical protein Desca_1627 [Desulfotomaculum nigrificans CO-1-SRB]|uniref:Nucleotidyltransferase n=1 Tax=Desulfotomaculum nigrificans (strain DSM 14880 / VKM B-2319 / CO-1-SRB) TaxID=868595 RepID=F6B750_DESCC|nr:nucleotidyltransferase [Desulfotomaculum nigrificans]AEF94475.1 hypothetical protein Desca_1627 [Desulfotomaculum nigrificans CO-1-SRB]
MSISDKFSTLIDNLKITNGDTISSRYKAITKRLNTDFWNSSSEISHSRYVGSVGRGTAIRGVSDVDMVMELPSDVYWQHDAYKSNGQSALLQAVKCPLAHKYLYSHGVSFHNQPAGIYLSPPSKVLKS